MKKQLNSVVLAAVLFSGSAFAMPIEFGFVGNYFSKIVENKIENVAAPIKETAGVSYIDAANFAKELGAEFIRNEGVFEIKKGDISIIYEVGSKTAKVNGEEREIAGVPYITTEGDMVPVRFTAETLGFTVDYIKTLDKVLVSSTPAIANVNGVNVSGDVYKLYFDINRKSVAEANVDVTDETLEIIKNGVTDILIQDAAIYSNAKKGGFDAVLDSEDVGALVKQDLEAFNATKGDIVNFDTVAAKVFEEKYIIQNYLNAVQVSMQTSDEEILDFYNNNYMRVKHILIMKANPETGAELTETEQDEAKAKAKQLLEKVKKGVIFDKLMKENSQDTGLEAYPDGYVFTKGEMVPEFEEAAIKLKVGEVSDVVETTYGYHILKKEKLPEEISAELKEEINYMLKAAKYNEYINGLITGAEINIYE